MAAVNVQYPPTTVEVRNTSILYKESECVSSVFYSTPGSGYKLRIALKSSNNRPTADHQVTYPDVQVSILALPQENNGSLNWPLRGDVEITIQNTPPGAQAALSVPFFIQEPMAYDPGENVGRPLPQSLSWTPLPQGYIPGSAEYHPPSQEDPIRYARSY